MKIILANGKELNPLLVTGASIQLQGAKRDSLTFVFPAPVGIEVLDEAFSAIACESIKIVDDLGVENIYKHYTIRAKLEKAPIVVVPATPEAESVTEDRISVCIAQRTYAENQLASLTDTVDVLVMESLMTDIEPETEPETETVTEPVENTEEVEDNV